MRLLDLYCGAGGAAMGYYRAGFTDILGVDIVDQPNYPFRFVRADVLDFVDAMIDTTEDTGYDLIHASPPCQRYSTATIDPSRHPDLVAPTREALDLIGRPYVIENVPGSPLDGQIRLCGSMFGLEVQRHRYFELSGFDLILTPPCNHKGWAAGRPWTVTGDLRNGDHGYRHSLKPSITRARDLLDVPWMTERLEIVEAIPPVYTEFIGRHFEQVPVL